MILTTYNRLQYLKTALASALSQTLAACEVVVVDGGSSDGTQSFLRRLPRGRAAAIRLEGNPGPGALMNAGLERVRGRFVAFLESDDYWLPTYLEEMVRGFDDRGVQALHGAFLLADGDGTPYGVVYADGRTLPLPARARRPGRILPPPPEKGWCRPYLSMMMARRSAFERCGTFDPSFRFLGADTDFHRRLVAAFGPCRTVDKVLALRRHHGDQLTAPLLMDWPRGETMTPMQRESFLDMACFHNRYKQGRSLHGAK